MKAKTTKKPTTCIKNYIETRNVYCSVSLAFFIDSQLHRQNVKKIIPLFIAIGYRLSSLQSMQCNDYANESTQSH